MYLRDYSPTYSGGGLSTTLQHTPHQMQLVCTLQDSNATNGVVHALPCVSLTKRPLTSCTIDTQYAYMHDRAVTCVRAALHLDDYSN